jgi:hypothetical protein
MYLKLIFKKIFLIGCKHPNLDCDERKIVMEEAERLLLQKHFSRHALSSTADI